MSDPKILVFGDSHSHAVQMAIAKREALGRPVPLRAHRLLKAKRTNTIGDTTFESFLKMIEGLRRKDMVVSLVGGNQHAVFSTIQHPRPFDVFDPEGYSPPAPGTEIIPYRALVDMMETGLRRGDFLSLKAIRDATRARVVHVAPPPPKEDNDFLQRHHDTVFASEGIGKLGVSPPELRLKFWKLQTRILQKLCAEIDVDLLMPPRTALEGAGFLAPAYHAKDATHANGRYGEMVVRQIERLAAAEPVAAGASA